MSSRIPYLYVMDSPGKGRGVFTGRIIERESIIEICPILYLPKEDIGVLQGTVINDYYFEWGDNGEGGAIALGYGSIYNHSFEPNAYYMVDEESNSISIYAFKDILPNEEITINYNGEPDDMSELWFETT